jgi:hypothetical protein
MNREEIEHVIRAAGGVLDEDQVIVVGSQAILAEFPDDLPRAVLLSREVDVMATDDPTGEKALLINGAIGEDTLFDNTFGVFAEGVERGLCQFPPGWEERTIELKTPATGEVTGLCPEIHDIAVAKLLAGRDKDFEWTRTLLQSGHLKPTVLLERLAATEMRSDQRAHIVGIVRAAAAPGKHNKNRREVRRLLSLLDQQSPESSEG